MTPIRDKPVKWEGEEETDRYKNVGGFKYDIIDKGTVYIRSEDFLSDFLGNTTEESKETYERFKKILNNLAFSYAVSTGLPKSDLFGEAVIGLARAKRDFDPTRSDDFKIFAITKMKDALREYVRSSSASVVIPAYLKSANSYVRKIEDVLKQKDFTNEEISDYLTEGKHEEKIPKDVKLICNELSTNLKNIAKRSKVSVDKLIDRARFVPIDTALSKEHLSEAAKERQVREEAKMHAALLVDKLKKYMSEEEIQIAEGIMMGETHDEIAKTLGMTRPAISQKLKGLRNRLAQKVKNGKLQL
jgi:RNA polymerase sigma factor (sigma-70 family)